MEELNIGDIVTIRPDLTTSSSTLKGQYKIISYNTKNRQYGIVPANSLFDLPMYYTREELVPIKSANKEESFLYKVGDYVEFKLSSNSKPLTGLITARHLNEEYKTEPAVGGYWVTNKYYKIKTFDKISISQYEVHESDIIGKVSNNTYDLGPQEAELTINTAERLSAAIKTLGKIANPTNEEKPLNIKIAKKQIKLNFKN